MCFRVFNLIGFYLFFESVLIPIFLIIYGWGGQPERLQAGIYIILYTLAGSLPLLLILLNYRKEFTISIFYLDYIIVYCDSQL
jgi:NADH-ubiquinone oxidoreductase chain 4